MDWSLGSYEHTAAQLRPAARVVVDRAEPRPGDHVVDVGCGTGNAALEAAERGCRVTGVDPAPRLLEVARREAARRGLEARFVAGDAASLPVESGAAEIVLSVFGVIFAPDPDAAAAEMARVTAPDGRILVSAWVPEGAIHDCVGALRAAVQRAAGGRAGPQPFPWHDQRALSRLLEPHGFTVAVTEERLAFTARSPREYLDLEVRHHPLCQAGLPLLESSGTVEDACGQALTILERANEDPEGFRVTSRYVIATARRG